MQTQHRGMGLGIYLHLTDPCALRISVSSFIPLEEQYSTYTVIHDRTDLCDSYEVCYDGSPLLGRGLAEHHKLDPLGDAVEEHDEALQDGVIYCAAVFHKAVIVLELNPCHASLSFTHYTQHKLSHTKILNKHVLTESFSLTVFYLLN